MTLMISGTSYNPRYVRKHDLLATSSMGISHNACDIGSSCAQLMLQFCSDYSELDLHHNLTQHYTQCKSREHLHTFERADEDQTGKFEDAKYHMDKCACLGDPEDEL